MRRRSTLTSLSVPQILELRVGPHPGHERFASDAEREAAWLEHGARLLSHMEPAKRSTCWALLTFGAPPGWTLEDARAADAALAAADAERQRQRLIAEEFTEP